MYNIPASFLKGKQYIVILFSRRCHNATYSIYELVIIQGLALIEI